MKCVSTACRATPIGMALSVWLVKCDGWERWGSSKPMGVASVARRRDHALRWRCIVRSRCALERSEHDVVEIDDRYRPHCGRAAFGRRDRCMVDHGAGLAVGFLLVSHAGCWPGPRRIVKNSLSRLGCRHPITRIQSPEWPRFVCDGRASCSIFCDAARSVTFLAEKRGGVRCRSQPCSGRASSPIQVSYGL